MEELETRAQQRPQATGGAALVLKFLRAHQDKWVDLHCLGTAWMSCHCMIVLKFLCVHQER